MAESILSKCIDMYVYRPQGPSLIFVLQVTVSVSIALYLLPYPCHGRLNPNLHLCSMASARLLAAVPSVVLWSSLRAAGVKFPVASERRGVILGGASFLLFLRAESLQTAVLE